MTAGSARVVNPGGLATPVVARANALALVAAAGGGALAFAGDYPGPIPLLHWLAPVAGLAFSVVGGTRRALGLGALFGLIATGRLWLDFDVAPLAGRAAMSILFAILYAGVFAFTARVAATSRWPALSVPWAFALACVSTEAFRELPGTGHWWTLAASQTEVGWLLPTASWGGSYLVSFLVALGSGGLASLVAWPGRRSLASAGLVTLVISICALTAALTAPQVGRPVRVAAVSVTTPADITTRWYQDRTMLDRDLWEIFDRYADATRRAAADGAEVVAWREFGLGVPSEERATLERRLLALARESGSVIVAGFVEAAARQNFALAVAPDGSHDLYAKRNLVPMAETRWLDPGQREFGWLEFNDLRIAVRICYDLDFPLGVHEAALAGANLLIAPSADWPGIHERHPMQSAVRSAEHGLPIVRPAEGLSTLIDARGRVVARALDTDVDEVVLTAALPLRAGTTPYTSTGGWLFVLPLLAVAIWGTTMAFRSPTLRSPT